LDLVQVTSGAITLLDRPATDPASRGAVTYLPGDLTLPKRLTGRQVLSRFTAGRPPLDPNVVSQLADAFGIDLDRRIGALSKGNRQKVGLLLALAPRTPLLLLDEPTSGLDPLVQQTFAELLAARSAEGATVMLSSHVLSELEHLAHRVAVLRDGALVAVESIRALQQHSRQHLTVDIADAADRSTLDTRLNTLTGVVVEWRGPMTVHIECGSEIDSVVKALASITIVRLATSQGDIEGRLLDFYQDST
jgi:ABC-2 type transport system ATP-binding protein